MRMESLGLIITGQLRTFFDTDVQDSFRAFLTGLKTKYTLYGALVINEPNIQTYNFDFLKQYMKDFIIIDYKQVHKEFNLKETIYTNLLEIEKELGVAEERAKESDGYIHITSFYYQISQIQEGIKALNSFNVPFHCLMRTRFDILYSKDIEIIPFSNMKSPLFSHSVEQEYLRYNLYRRYKLSSIQEYLEWAADISWESPLRIHDLSSILGFGGRYYNNLDILEKENYIWMYNDHMIIGTLDTFKTLMNIWDNFLNKEYIEKIINKAGIQFLFAPESLFLIHFLSYTITPIMYLDGTWGIKR